MTRSSEPAPRTLRPGRKLWVGTLSQPPETRGSLSPPGRRRNLGFSTRGQFSRARPSGPVAHSPRGAPSGTHSWDRCSTSSRIPRSNWPTLWARSPGLPTGTRGGLFGACSPRSAQGQPGSEEQVGVLPRPATLTAHPRERNARPDPPWYRSGSRTGPPGCAQSPSWRARLRSGAASPDCGVTEAGRALPGHDPGPPPSPSPPMAAGCPACSPRPFPKANRRIPSPVLGPDSWNPGCPARRSRVDWRGDSRGGEGSPRLSLHHGAVSTQGIGHLSPSELQRSQESWESHP